MLTLIGNVLALVVMAQGTTTVSGIVIDKNTQRPLVGASVQLTPGNKGTVTDEAGKFSVSGIAPGVYTFVVSNLNFLPFTLNNLTLTAGNEATLTIELEALPNQLDNVEVKSAA